MCEPTTIAMTAMAVSGGLQAYGQYAQGRAAKDQAYAQAAMQEVAADDARRRGMQEAGRQRSRIKQILGRQTTATAASGVDVGTGTALDLFDETATLGEFDAQVIENNAMREAWGYDTQAEFTRFEGRSAKRAGTVGAAATLLGTGGRMASMGGGGGGGGPRRAGGQSMAPQSSGFIPANTPGRRI